MVFMCAAISGFSQPKSGKKEKPRLWLDAAKPQVWNHAGRRIPRVPRGAGLDESCSKDRYQAQSAEEKSVAAAGWFLIAKAVNHNGITVVGGQASNDGMCRPTEYQYFVFVRGEFAGTLSPALMNSRTDGSAVDVSVPGDGRIVADFLRYGDQDALCCPSRISSVEFGEVEVQGKPVVVIKEIKTRRAE